MHSFSTVLESNWGQVTCGVCEKAMRGHCLKLWKVVEKTKRCWRCQSHETSPKQSWIEGEESAHQEMYVTASKAGRLGHLSHVNLKPWGTVRGRSCRSCCFPWCALVLLWSSISLLCSPSSLLEFSLFMLEVCNLLFGFTGGVTVKQMPSKQTLNFWVRLKLEELQGLVKLD